MVGVNSSYFIQVQVAIMLQQPRLATDMIPFQVAQYPQHIGFYVYAGDKPIEKVCDSADRYICIFYGLCVFFFF